MGFLAARGLTVVKLLNVATAPPEQTFPDPKAEAAVFEGSASDVTVSPCSVLLVTKSLDQPRERKGKWTTVTNARGGRDSTRVGKALGTKPRRC